LRSFRAVTDGRVKGAIGTGFAAGKWKRRITDAVFRMPYPMSVIEPIQKWLFGDIQKIEIHCDSLAMGEKMRACVKASLLCLDRNVPIALKRCRQGPEFVMVHYASGLLRDAHADIMVISAP
jgi:hypothetical protein